MVEDDQDQDDQDADDIDDLFISRPEDEIRKTSNSGSDDKTSQSDQRRMNELSRRLNNISFVELGNFVKWKTGGDAAFQFSANISGSTTFGSYTAGSGAAFTSGSASAFQVTSSFTPFDSSTSESSTSESSSSSDDEPTSVEEDTEEVTSTTSSTSETSHEEEESLISKITAPIKKFLS